jgi:threonine/homoserine/homoserine lactone efflux protein
LLWLPVVLLLVGFALTYLTYLEQIPADLAGPVELYIQFFFVPYGLFTFFIAGFIAPRAAYLIGFLLGLLNGLLWTILIFVGTTLPTLQDPTEPAPVVDPITAAGQVVLVAMLYGTLAAAFASWYRNFLRQMQERGRQRRADREAQERAKRREERHAARRGG